MIAKAKYHFMDKIGAPALLGLENYTTKRKRAKKAKKKSTSSKEQLFGPPLHSEELIKQLMMKHYLMARYAKGAMPVAWVTSGAPVEILRTFGMYTVYPENHAALVGARKMGPEIQMEAENVGFSRDLCSYARIDLGFIESGKTPAGKMPKPDLMLCGDNICQTVMYWYRAIAEKLDIPLYIINTPFIEGEIKPHQTEFFVKQIQEVIEDIEKRFKLKFDYNKFKEVAIKSKEASEIWGEILYMSAYKPAPTTIFDAFVYMAPVVALRGSDDCLVFYDKLLAELKDRTNKGIGAVLNEKHRILWDNIPVWFKIRELSSMFARAGMNFVVATYTNAWAESAKFIDPDRPFESMARSYSEVVLNVDLNYRKNLMSRLIKEFSVDGMVMHSNRSCKPYSVGQYDLIEILKEEFGIPGVVLESDQTDFRMHSDEQSNTRLEAFIEAY